MHVPKKIPVGGADEIVYSKPLQDNLESMSRKERRDYMRDHGGFKHPKRFKVKRGDVS